MADLAAPTGGRNVGAVQPPVPFDAVARVPGRRGCWHPAGDRQPVRNSKPLGHAAASRLQRMCVDGGGKQQLQIWTPVKIIIVNMRTVGHCSCAPEAGSMADGSGRVRTGTTYNDNLTVLATPVGRTVWLLANVREAPRGRDLMVTARKQGSTRIRSRTLEGEDEAESSGGHERALGGVCEREERHVCGKQQLVTGLTRAFHGRRRLS